jgi:integrase/recombinase XerD
MGRTRQYAGRVNVIKRIKIGACWPFAAVVEKNGKLVRDHVWVAGKDEHHPEGRYYIEWYEAGKRRRQAVKDFAGVVDAARRKSIEVSAQKEGIIEARAAVTPELNGGRITAGRAIDEYLEFTQVHRKRRTYLSYRYTLDTLLRASYRKPFVDQVTREDILEFMSHCYRLGLGKRTVYDKLVVALQLFKRHGMTNLIKRGDWPDYVDAIRPIYEAEEVEAMLKASTEREATVIKFLLCSGFRDQEARFLEWRDIDFRNNVVRVTAKPRWGFTPKNWEERVVPVPTNLMECLRKLKNQNDAGLGQLVFPNTRGNPDSEMDAIIKKVAARAELNCGRCVTAHGNRCATGPYCQNYFLHKFRHTFATEHLRSGIDIRTLQGWMGHRDIQSTMVYLKGVQSKDALAKVNAGALARYVS